MSSDLLKDPRYRQRFKPTRTQFFEKAWRKMSKAASPEGLGLLFRERVHIEPEYQKLMAAADLDSVRGVFESTLGKMLTNDGVDGDEDVTRIRLMDGSLTRTFYVKRYWNREFTQMKRRAIRGSWVGPSVMRAEFERVAELGRMGLRVPRLVAYGDQRLCGGVVNTFMITEEIPDAMGVDFVVHKWIGEHPPEQQRLLRDELIEECARMVKVMHAHGFEHHDLFFRNIMISGQSMSNVYFFDCPCAFHWPQFIMKFRCVHDLATLDAAAGVIFSRSQRMRFMHQYLGVKRLSSKNKDLVRAVLKRADPIREQQIRRLLRSLPAN